MNNEKITSSISLENKCEDSASNRIRKFDGLTPVYNLGCGDSYYIPSFLSRQISDCSFKSLLNGREIKWYQTYIYNENTKTMIAQKRLTNTQIQVNHNHHIDIVPLYRYPTNNLQSMPIRSRYSKSVKIIIDLVQKQISQPINHVVTAIYRDGRDFIGFHSDKMLDIMKNSQIGSISLGTKREFVFKELDKEKGKEKQDHIILYHGSLIVIGPETNKYFRHSIIKNHNIKTPRISLSLRYINTFWNKSNNKIFGQGEQYQNLNYPLKPFDSHNIKHKIHCVDYKYDKLNTFNNCDNYCNGYKYDIDKDEVLMKYFKKNEKRARESFYMRKDSHFRCILFENIKDKNDGYKILEYLKQEKYPKCIHIPYAMIIIDKDIKNNILEYNNDGEPQRAKIGENLMKILKENYRENNYKNVMIVVIRHWLGTKLGLNNLYNCYDIVVKLMFDKCNGTDNMKRQFLITNGYIVVFVSILIFLLSYIISYYL